MENLTVRQQEILDFLKEWIAQHSMPPTRAEMCGALGFRSPNAAEEHLRALARVSRLMRQADVREHLRKASGADAIRALLVREARPSAA